MPTTRSQKIASVASPTALTNSSKGVSGDSMMPTRSSFKFQNSATMEAQCPKSKIPPRFLRLQNQMSVKNSTFPGHKGTASSSSMIPNPTSQTSIPSSISSHPVSVSEHSDLEVAMVSPGSPSSSMKVAMSSDITMPQERVTKLQTPSKNSWLSGSGHSSKTTPTGLINDGRKKSNVHTRSLFTLASISSNRGTFSSEIILKNSSFRTPSTTTISAPCVTENLPLSSKKQSQKPPSLHSLKAFPPVQETLRKRIPYSPNSTFQAKRNVHATSKTAKVLSGTNRTVIVPNECNRGGSVISETLRHNAWVKGRPSFTPLGTAATSPKGMLPPRLFKTFGVVPGQISGAPHIMVPPVMSQSALIPLTQPDPTIAQTVIAAIDSKIENNATSISSTQELSTSSKVDVQSQVIEKSESISADTQKEIGGKCLTPVQQLDRESADTINVPSSQPSLNSKVQTITSPVDVPCSVFGSKPPLLPTPPIPIWTPSGAFLAYVIFVPVPGLKAGHDTDFSGKLTKSKGGEILKRTSHHKKGRNPRGCKDPGNGLSKNSAGGHLPRKQSISSPVSLEESRSPLDGQQTPSSLSHPPLRSTSTGTSPTSFQMSTVVAQESPCPLSGSQFSHRPGIASCGLPQRISRRSENRKINGRTYAGVVATPSGDKPHSQQ